jgi:hypothetical protein
MLPLLILPFLASSQQPTTIDLRKETVITSSATVLKREYEIANSWDETSEPSGAVLIAGDNITVDFNGATLRGTSAYTDPDKRIGCAIEVQGKNVTIKNVNVHGYKLGLYAQDAPGLKVLDSDFSYNWKQRLKSTPEREDLSDWMSYHQNEKNEWLRFGAAMYLRRCDGFEVKGVKVHGGQNGLMFTECNKGLVWNNDFSFNSSLGIGMYRSSDNRIMHNKIDWNVRGFSYGVYNRGQDSAGILIYEQSHRNTFAYNSVTHGGDGFFLWAGQTTMDTGKGGCNDNLLYGNDFSHAPTNGIEATFSRNHFVNNLILECWHGIWGGYSYESKVIGNVFGYNTEAIAWEHGQDNVIRANRFYRNNEDAVIWANASQDPNWGYAKKRDTRSRDWLITENIFEHTFAQPFRLARSENLSILGNLITNVPRVFEPSKTQGAEVHSLRFSNNGVRMSDSGELPEGNAVKIDPLFKPLPSASALKDNEQYWFSREQYLSRFDVIRRSSDPIDTSKLQWFPYPSGMGGSGNYDPERTLREGHLLARLTSSVQPLKGGIDPFLKKGTLRGWRYMIVDEWGPYDFKSPMLVARGHASDAGPGIHAMDGFSYRSFEVLGPAGKYRVLRVNGVPATAVKACCGGVSPLEGSVPGMFRLPVPNEANELHIEVEFVGEKTIDYRGVVTPKGKPVRFGYRKFFAPINWTVRWYPWNSKDVNDPKAAMPRPQELLTKEQLAQPAREVKTDRLDFAWSGSPGPGVPADYFMTLADGTFEIAKGDYQLQVTTDDGMRIWIDDVMILESWRYQGPTQYTANVRLAGKHRIRVEHYEINGYAALKVELVPRR